MSRRGPRGLTPEEQSLWNKVKERTAALHPDRPQQQFFQKASKPAPEPAPRPVFEPFQIGERRGETSPTHNLAPPIGDALGKQPVQMDKKNFGKLKRGKLQPEARIDLHGMTLDRAHGALNRFILDGQASGRRLVLVITGKGKPREQDGPIPIRHGVLKHQVPQWLNAPALRAAVLQITEAHLKHGGSGAYYVYLRRRR